MLENSAMSSIVNGWSQWFLVSTLESCVLLLAISLIWLVIRKKSSPQVGMWLFLLVPLKLLCPISLPAPTEVANIAPANSVQNLIAWESNSPAEAVPNPVRLNSPPTTMKPAYSNASNSNHMDLQPINPPASVPIKTSEPANEAPRMSGMSMASVAFLVWVVISLLLLLRFVYSQIVLANQFRSASKVDLGALSICFESTARLAGWKISDTPKLGRVQLLESSDASSPIVIGLLCPKIVLPAHFSQLSSAEHLRWTVLHELAHIKRFDLWFSLVQRLVAIVCWFNPAVWIANHFVDRFREFACDDFASLKSHSKSVQAGEAFIEVVRFASSVDSVRLNALGFFGWNESAKTANSEIKIRLGRILDETRCMRLSMGRLPAICLAILAVATIPKLQASGDQEQQPAASETGLIRDTGDFELLVVDSKGEPISKAKIEIRSEWKFGAEKVKVGSFQKKNKYGTELLADDKGVLKLSVPKTPKRFDLFIRANGYGPYYSPWDDKSASLGIPSRQKVILDSAWTATGIVVDPNGKPVVNARVTPSLRFKTRPGMERDLHVGTSIKTDANGQWEYPHVPVHLSSLSVEIKYKQYKPFRAGLSRDQYELIDGKQREKISMEEGLTVTGTVTDKDGNPVEGALVRTKFLNHERETKTGSDGVYKLVGCEPRNARIVVSAPEKALELKEVAVTETMDPVDFVLGPGNLIRIKVVDPEGKPIANAGFHLQNWGTDFRVDYFEFDHVKCKTNQDGIWEWHEAPNDAFTGDIYYFGSRGEFMSLSRETIEITDELQVFELNPQLYVSGKVTDAETGEPVKAFRVIPGLEAQQRNTQSDDAINAENGRYRIKHFRQSYPIHFVRIEADGYQPVESRDIAPDEGEVSIDFKLERATNIVSRVVTPDGKPADGATVVLGVSGSQISINNGRLNKSSTFQSPNVNTDANGEFQFPPREKGFHLIVLHEDGFAHIATGQSWFDPKSNLQSVDSVPEEIELTPWSQVTGTAKTGAKPLANKKISLLGGLHSYGNNVPNIFTRNDVVAGKNGSFKFERVFAGRCSISRNIALVVSEGAMEVASSRREFFNVSAGQSVKVDVGGKGRAVVGKLLPAKQLTEKPRWKFADISVSRHVDVRPPTMPNDVAADATKSRIWYEKWLRTPPGQEYTRLNAIADNSPSFLATVDDEGNFRIDDMPKGKYRMRVTFHQHSAGSLNGYLFEVDNESAEAPIKLGNIKLK